jgi:hypothetical protein
MKQRRWCRQQGTWPPLEWCIDCGINTATLIAPDDHEYRICDECLGENDIVLRKTINLYTNKSIDEEEEDEWEWIE